MEPALKAGSRVKVDTGYYNDNPVQRFDVVIVKDPDDWDNQDKKYAKRVIGLSGETVQIKSGKVYINGKELIEPFKTVPADKDFGPFTVPDYCFFFLGDDRAHSYDSRHWKNIYVNQNHIIGKVD